jgi:hypothetical protein
MIKEVDQKLVKGMAKMAESYNLTNQELFAHKCYEFHDMTSIRFGNMIVGPPMAGKSEI